jgi:tRNA nucleotidyltransferase (CCA-adding enzyme)
MEPFAIDDLDPRVLGVAQAIREAGGRAVLVGGWVRDRLLGTPSKDVDVEVFGLSGDALREVLGRFGEVIAVGRAFGVYLLKGLDVDFALPRRDSLPGVTVGDADGAADPTLDFATAARRRDLTINAMGFDPLTGEVLDPTGGRDDIAARRLRAACAETFGEDPLRALRVAQFRARFGFEPDAGLRAICRGLDLDDVAPERVLTELDKLLLKGERPSAGLAFLLDVEQLDWSPELRELVGVPQDPIWHPEGDVWIHTLMVLDEAAKLRTGDRERDRRLMLSALLHDIGKPPCTQVGGDGRVRSVGHEAAGVPPTRALLSRLRASQALVAAVAALVQHHLAPWLLPKQGASLRAYRRLARQLAEAGTTPEELHDLALADRRGRGTDEARRGRFGELEGYTRIMSELGEQARAGVDVVLGRHLIARGLEPGPVFGEVLARCRDIQDATGWTDPGRILDRALAGDGA